MNRFLEHQLAVLNLDTKVSRLFFAIATPAIVRARLMGVQRELKQLLPGDSAAWTKPQNMHLTLRFLGEVEVTRIPELLEEITAGLAGFGELALVCERLGCFPDQRFPRVVWAGVHDEQERLSELHRRVEETAKVFSALPAEAHFIGHVTLARPKRIKRSDAQRLTRFVEGAATRRFGQWPVQSVTLLRSQLSPAGARYEELFCANLT